MSFDSFGHSVSFLVDGKGKSQSIFGAFVSLLSAVLVGSYFIYQFQLMVRYSNTNVSYILNQNVFESTDIIQAPKDRLGFNIAFGVVDIDTNKAVEGIDKTGYFFAEHQYLNLGSIDFREIPIHKCTQEDRNKFYKPNKVYQGDFNLLFTELYCITSPDKLVFKGDLNGD